MTAFCKRLAALVVEMPGCIVVEVLYCVLSQSILGLSYSLLACALWPMVAFVVAEHQLGTAYGL